MRHEKILVVEDDREIGQLITTQLAALNLHVDHVVSAELALKKIAKQPYGLILLDINLPQMDGLSLCRKIKEHYPTISVILLTALSSDMDRVIGLEMGADDYICKPFFARELQARVKTQLRHRSQLLAIQNNENDSPCNEQTLNIGSLNIEFSSHQVYLDEQALNLTATEFDLLVYFARHPNHVFSRQQLLDKVWGYQHSGYEHTVNSHINRLRAKLELHHQAPIIETVWGVGYKLNPSQLT
ncbi:MULTISPECIES: response regulator transcription factor [Pseudoalteromonas]|jgi:DNA-binding response OmpR family regulator|uniref:response regulator transcription factor n=1 Tax=Pseudoalteromonas TaxID=53246 RepID=UPI0002CA07A7|nr:MULTISPECIES: response regulator transcription factor [Pseudoalteromonas]MAJ40651.1 DNA-binding response regulator [Pseudoalteromonadaceae bacterium]MCP4056160.1 response regulator transcription factor [Pseudoalteromonas sp.]MDY6887464.1 response regulator transcription factor [Pseudomonadota bacterium]OUX86470.1 MAG: DNA-binding response regulator [Pseudoalteromonas sp. TMED43]ENN97574.1 two component transcriptional regulator, winged helix family protein [Pseudoalteromonas agarivorans S81|tara:strand:- start:82 stop:807 length:726 start_codon:yes stop_codon:yes gene_type:complete